MSSSGRNTLHRRRSHSASSPLTSIRHSAGDKWRPSYKRARQDSTRGSLRKDNTVDNVIDRHRDGKRARRDSSSPVLSSRGPCLFGSSSVFREEWASLPSPSPPAQLPCTSDAFHLFPDRPRMTREPSPGLHASPDSGAHLSLSSSPAEEPAELTQLRSSAFWELQQSITQNGEGMVNRMRDWEASHTQSFLKAVTRDLFGQPVLPREQSPSSTCTSEALNEDEEEIQIIEASSSSTIEPSCQLPLHSSWRSGVLTAGSMDVDDCGASLGVSCSSPADGSPWLSPVYVSDEDSPVSLALTDSSNSSRTSLPLHSLDRPTVYKGRRRSSLGAHSSASPSEKAIDALTLSMATGAGGLNDYEAVRSLEGPYIATLDGSLVGEMWH
ncbi:hypothetical protein BC835DRAFT_1517451 [Cytidiella melzeri]|nr:hypothetical protein BC835DRAFT_1517451 [Cytidiella melzeri]